MYNTHIIVMCVIYIEGSPEMYIYIYVYMYMHIGIYIYIYI